MLLSKTILWCEMSGQQSPLGRVEEGERVKCRGFWGLEMFSFMIRVLVTWGCSLCNHLLMICILLCMYDKLHNKVYPKKKKKSLIKLATKNLFFLKSSRSWNFHILLEAVYMNTAFSGEQFSNMDLNSQKYSYLLTQQFHFRDSILRNNPKCQKKKKV